MCVFPDSTCKGFVLNHTRYKHSNINGEFIPITSSLVITLNKHIYIYTSIFFSDGLLHLNYGVSLRRWYEKNNSLCTYITCYSPL